MPTVRWADEYRLPTKVAGLATIMPAPFRKSVPKQTDTGGNRHFQTHRQCVDQHFLTLKAEQDENQTGNEHRTQRHLPRHAHTLNDGKVK